MKEIIFTVQPAQLGRRLHRQSHAIAEQRIDRLNLKHLAT
jgi:hypothetical protein